MHAFDAIRWQALRDVYLTRKEKDGADPNYFFRKIFRWYSKEFSTPLHLVEELPVQDIMQAWYEQTFEDLEDQVLDELVKKSAITEEQQRAIDLREDSDKAFEHEITLEAEGQNKRISTANQKLEDAVKPLQNAFAQMLADVRKGNSPESELVPRQGPKAKPIKANEGIHMTFLTPEEMEEELNRDPFDLFPGKKIG